MGGGHETVHTDALRGLAGRFDSDVGSHLDAALAELDGASSIEYANFTAVAATLAVAYVEAINFQKRDLQRKRDTATSYGIALKKTADDWDAAESASTVRIAGD